MGARMLPETWGQFKQSENTTLTYYQLVYSRNKR